MSQDSVNVYCLLSKGYVLQYSQRWKDAEAIFNRLLQLEPEYDVQLETREEKAWCIVKDGRLLEGIEEYRTVIEDLEKEEDKSDKKAQAWWRLGQAYWSLGGTSFISTFIGVELSLFSQTNTKKLHTKISSLL